MSISEVKDAISVISGALTPIIALITVYIAFQQYVTARRKLRMDLYEKRYRVFEGLKRFLAEIVRDGRVTDTNQRQFLIDTKESLFLFDKGVNDYLKLIYEKSCEKWLCDQELDDIKLPVGEKRSEYAKKDHDLTLWLSEQMEISNEKFKKYLSFEKF